MPKVLVVEDDKTLRDVYATILRLATYGVDVASNGMVALELCNKNHYDVILLDLMMPILNGVGFLQQANLQATSQETNVIIFSNLSSGSPLEESMQLGVVDHVLKSHLTPQSLVTLVQRYALA